MGVAAAGHRIATQVGFCLRYNARPKPPYKVRVTQVKHEELEALKIDFY